MASTLNTRNHCDSCQSTGDSNEAGGRIFAVAAQENLSFFWDGVVVPKKVQVMQPAKVGVCRLDMLPNFCRIWHNLTQNPSQYTQKNSAVLPTVEAFSIKTGDGQFMLLSYF